MFFAEKNFSQAREFYKKAKNFPTPYDFDRPLGYRISKGLQRTV